MLSTTRVSSRHEKSFQLKSIEHIERHVVVQLPEGYKTLEFLETLDLPFLGGNSCETGSLLSLPALAANYTKAATAGVGTKKLSQQSCAILIHVAKYLLWLTM